MDVSNLCRDILRMDSLTELSALSKQVNAAIKMRYNELQRRKAVSFGVGSRVEFTDKLGNVVTGRILKINPKTVQVRSDRTMVTWRVTPSLLRAAKSEAA